MGNFVTPGFAVAPAAAVISPHARGHRRPAATRGLITVEPGLALTQG
jgi:hypothetical protein